MPHTTHQFYTAAQRVKFLRDAKTLGYPSEDEGVAIASALGINPGTLKDWWHKSAKGVLDSHGAYVKGYKVTTEVKKPQGRQSELETAWKDVQEWEEGAAQAREYLKSLL